MRAIAGVVAIVVAVSLVTLGGAGAQQNQPGVTDTEIRVGGVATATNDPTGGTYGSAFDGVEAYFEYINSTEDGVHGRKLVLSSKRDDALGNNRQEVQGLLSQDNVFAVLPVSVALFTGADLLAQSGVPTFGWLQNAEWGSEEVPSPPNFFGQVGSYLRFSSAWPNPMVWLPKKLGLKRVGVLAYNVPQSSSCAESMEKSFEKYPTAKVVFSDKSLTFGNPDYTAQVTKMVEEQVDYVIPCVDANGAINLAREMKKQGLDAVQMLPNQYKPELVKENAQFLNGSYVFLTFTPFEARPKSPGMKLYEKWIKRTDGAINENSLYGWLNADLFVTGLKAAGQDFTRQKVIAGINQIKDYNAGGILAGVDWTTAHQEMTDCLSLVKIVNGRFKAVFGKPREPFLCFPKDLETIPKNPETTG
jgi:ABC-type branched-subunit amino acid transport system substrate-binding protein